MKYKIQAFLGGEWVDYYQGPFTREEAESLIFREVKRFASQPGETETLADLNRWRPVELEVL